ncbi:14741_t:CDS:2, partial [Racocetra fulgida]
YKKKTSSSASMTSTEFCGIEIGDNKDILSSAIARRQQNGHSDPRAQLEQTIDQLLTKIWEIMVQLNEYDSENKWAVNIPFIIIRFIDEGRNPDIFMADYVEEVMQENQAVKVKNEAIQ